MKHLQLFEHYGSACVIEETIYSADGEEAGMVAGVVHTNPLYVSNWLHKYGSMMHSYADAIMQYGLPIAFLDNVNIEEDYRNQGLGNEAYELFMDAACTYEAKAIVLLSDKGESQREGFDLDRWYLSKGFEILVSDEYNSLMILQTDF